MVSKDLIIGHGKTVGYTAPLNPKLLLFFFFLFWVTCTSDFKTKTLAFEDFAGTESCKSCHADVYHQFVHTLHFKTAALPGQESILGSFAKDKNLYWYSPVTKVQLEMRDSGYFQVAYHKGEEKLAMPMNYVVGSGNKGQSFISWKGNRLVQLPITYFTAADAWSISPGYPPGKVMLDKPITARCLECHFTYAQPQQRSVLEPTEFHKDKMIEGITCERCHGPAKAHADYHTLHPVETQAKFIQSLKSLTTSQSRDLCALCHGGNISKTQPSFSYQAGMRLSDYFDIHPIDLKSVTNGNVDVHGNQAGLLQSSKCYSSAKMTCLSCHDVHQDKRGDLSWYSQKCIACHHLEDAAMETITHKKIVNLQSNCIDCHMPSAASRVITVFVQGEETPRASKVRTHFISRYQDASSQFLKETNKNK